MDTSFWLEPTQPFRSRRKRQIWRNLWFTPLGKTEFVNSRDLTVYG